MLSAYNTHTDAERRTMMHSIGVADATELFDYVPKDIPKAGVLNLPSAMPERALMKHMRHLAASNATPHSYRFFMGGGTYYHSIPAVVDAIASRGEFLTSYTPYQPEMSQGLLQALFEYQESMKCITGMEIVNSSCYDGTTALADGIWMGCLTQDKKIEETHTILIDDSIWPDYREVVDTYMTGRKVKMHTLASDSESGQIDLEKLEDCFKQHSPSCFAFQTPNKWGVLEDVSAVTELCKKYNVRSVLSYYPMLSALCETPGAMGVDIVTGSGQSLGLPMRAGGSGLGIFATHKAYRKYVPGRLVGKVTDINGNPAYALVYEDREQHVAREKATSNICSNQALNAIRSAIYLASVGEHGLTELAHINAANAYSLITQLCEIEGVSRVKQGAYFNEAVLNLPASTAGVLGALHEKGIMGGIDVSPNEETHHLLVCATEMADEDDIQAYIDAMKEVLS